MPRRPPNLILRKIQIPIRRNRHTIRPANPRIPYKHTQQPSRRIEDIDSVLFEITQIDEPVAVRLEAVGDAFLAVRDHGCLSADFGEGGVVAQARGGDAVQIAARDGGPVEGFAVGAGRAGDDALVGAGDAVDGLAPDELEELLLGADLRDVVEVAPRGAGAEVDDDEAVAAFGAGVGDVGDSLARGGDVRPEVETDVVEVLGRWSVRSRGGGKDWTYGIWVCNGGWEDDGLEDCVI